MTINSQWEINRVQLYSASGELVKESTPFTKSYTLDNNLLPNGIYLLKIETEKGINIKKVVKE